MKRFWRLNFLGITVGPEAEASATRLDGQHTYRTERRVTDAVMKARIQQRKEQVGNLEHLHDDLENLSFLLIVQ